MSSVTAGSRLAKATGRHKKLGETVEVREQSSSQEWDPPATDIMLYSDFISIK